MMTERLTPVPPPTATTALATLDAAATNLQREATLVETLDEEPYTIKCICDYSDDDGATIYCERCDTWQHIDCFYHGNVEEASRDDFNHFCADCKPRPFDRRKATDRQRQQRQDRTIQDVNDKKPKRLPSKSHKKKAKPAEVQVNGHVDHNGGYSLKASSPHSAPTQPAKKSRGHRSQPSISAQVRKCSPSNGARNHVAAHPPSPANTPPDLPDDFQLHSYSKHLQEMYDGDPGAFVTCNTAASMDVTNAMVAWYRDPEKVRSDTGAGNIGEIAQPLVPDFSFQQYHWPPLQTKTKEIAADGHTFQLRYLAPLEPIRNPCLLGELSGEIGFQKDYWTAEQDVYQRLCHPPPFVFFTSSLPLFIDTRKGGSQCRYVRRSCRPNAILETYITKHGEYHFCVVGERPVSAGEQITVGWNFNFKAAVSKRWLYFLGLSDEPPVEDLDMSEAEFMELDALIQYVLSEYGGCACGLDGECAFMRFYRSFYGRLHAQAAAPRPKKARKPKTQISPTSTGHATNSRDASEGRQENYDAEDDSRSTSGSVRSKPQSRDMTPLVPGADAHGANDQISEREKRKLAEIERKFEQIDQAQPRKKKRTSDGTSGGSAPAAGQMGSHKKTKTTARPSISTTVSGLPNGHSAHPYRDNSTSRQQSGSPGPKTVPADAISPTLRQSSRAPSPPVISRAQSSVPSNYVDVSVQTEPDDNAWYSKPTTPKKRIVPLSKRLLSSRHKLRAEREAHRQKVVEGEGLTTVTSQTTLPPVVRPSSVGPHDSDMTGIEDVDETDVDISMPDAPSKPAVEDTIGDLSAISTGLSNSSTGPPNKAPRSPELRVQMPPVPTFSSASLASISNGAVTPSSASGSIAQSPFAAVHYPSAFSTTVMTSVGSTASPIKKKLSLSDYKARLKKQPDTSSKGSASTDLTGPATLEPSESLLEEAKQPGAVEGSAIVDSPAEGSIVDPLASAGSAIEGDASPKDNGRVPNGTL